MDSIQRSIEATRIRSQREIRNLTQAAIADYLQTAQTVYSRYELDKHPLPLNHLRELCKLYNVSSDYILGLIDEPRQLYD